MKKTARWTVLALIALSLAACSLDKPGVTREPYVARPIPKAFDEAMAHRRDDGVLWAGAQAVDLTPTDREAWLAGFNQMRQSHGALDPVKARLVYLDDGREAVVLIALDLVGLPRAYVQRLRSLITAAHPRRIQVASTHNHEGPDSLGYWGPGLLVPVASGVDQEWLSKAMQAIALGVNEAIRAAQPVRLAVGEAEVEPEWSSNIWFPHNQGPIDRRMGVIRLERRDGTALATIVNWACHAETLLSINEQVSADYPGRLCSHLERRGGGVAVFFNGALGGMISPRICRFDERGKWSDLKQRIAWMDRMGDRLSELAMNAAQSGPRLETARVAVRSGDLSVPIRNALFVAMARRRLLPVGEAQPHAARFPSEVGLVKLGPAWLAMVPGEPFPRLGQLLKEAMPFARPPLVVGLANDELAYMMMPEQWTDDHYDYERSMSTGPQTGRLVYEAFVGLLAQER